ncbi:major capsid protein [Capybara microvirus Cap3_SP_468]|nr:major capsid protein [Capybara microvirus Cap3_SP_468]
MSNQKVFSVNPSVSITRSKFKRPSMRKTTIKLGEITPIYLEQDMLPGDTWITTLNSFIRMLNPVVPPMSSIFFDFYFFYVPNRLTFSHWKELMGENQSSAGIFTGDEFTVPTVDLYNSGNDIVPGSLADHFGLPIVSQDPNKHLEVSVLPGRAYVLIYNEFFRDQNLIAPFPLALDDSRNISPGKYAYHFFPLVAAKESDYFTRALPYAQKGNPVSIPLGTQAPIKLLAGDIATGIVDGYVKPDSNITAHKTGTFSIVEANGVSAGSHVGTLFTDLSNATAATINSLRFAFQYQKVLEKDALYGTRYWEIIKGHFGVTAPDASLQRPQLIGKWRQHIVVNQVVQTTGKGETPSDNSLGSLAAVSSTFKGGMNFVHNSVEHGMIIGLAVARHEQLYSQGVHRGWTRKTRNDYYMPEYANLGAQSILNKEIFAQGSSADDEVFGYQEAWADYRYKPSTVTGYLRKSLANKFAPWTLSTNFGSLPTLSQSFIEQDRNAIKDLLGTGENGPDFLCDFYFDETMIRPMPLYSIPGLIDHH